MVICSRFRAQAVQDGEPAPGIRVVRRWGWTWNDDRGEDSTVTDENGWFEFPEVRRMSLGAMLLPHTPGISQEISVEIAGTTRVVWRHIKSDYRNLSEFGGRAAALRCHLDENAEGEFLYAGSCELMD